MDASPIARMLASSKAIVMMVILSLAFLALMLGKATWEQVENLVKWVFGSWVMAVGVEDAAKHVAKGKVDAATVGANSYIQVESMRPGPNDVDGMNDTIPPPPFPPSKL